MKKIFKISVTFILFFFSTAWAENTDLPTVTIENQIQEFILKNPEIILESLKRYEEKITFDAKKVEKEFLRNKSNLYNQNDLDYIAGNPDGQITIIEFLDYRCGYCKKVHSELQKLLTDNPEVKFIVKEFPILGNESLMASKASIAVLINYGESIYKIFTSKLFEYSGTINQTSIASLIESSGGDWLDIQLTMESQKVMSVLNSNFLLANKLKITGTPTFIIGTEIIRGYKDIETLQEIINTEKQAI